MPVRDDRTKEERLCDRMLRAVEDAHPQISSQFSSWLEQRGQSQLDGLDRKVAKLLALRKHNPQLFETLLRSMTPQRSVPNYFAFFETYHSHLYPLGKHTGGNFRKL